MNMTIMALYIYKRTTKCLEESHKITRSGYDYLRNKETSWHYRSRPGTLHDPYDDVADDGGNEDDHSGNYKQRL